MILQGLHAVHTDLSHSSTLSFRTPRPMLSALYPCVSVNMHPWCIAGYGGSVRRQVEALPQVITDYRAFFSFSALFSPALLRCFPVPRLGTKAYAPYFFIPSSYALTLFRLLLTQQHTGCSAIKQEVSRPND